MCDTIVALPSVTKDGNTLFGKNSDRESDEPQNIEIIERNKNNVNSTIKCTYIEIPQVEETCRTLLFKPYWMFGAEMGMNEYGVCIGNEALLTKVEPLNTGLTGMDLLRLSLERCNSAKSAKDEIIRLLETFGQGGNCGYSDKLKYMNGFLIADNHEAFVLETVEKNWAWKKIQDLWSISNRISITNDYDAISEELIPYAKQKKWCKSESDFNFSKAYSNKIITWGAAAKKRQDINRSRLLEKKKNLTIEDFFSILRNHGNNSKWTPYNTLRMSVCAHASNNLTKHTQTTCSFIANLQKDTFKCYTTGASNPCLSLYFPLFSNNTKIPSSYKPSSEYYNEEHFWWYAEKIHRKAILDYGFAKSFFENHLKNIEHNMIIKNEETKKGFTQEEINEYFAQVVNNYKKWEDYLENANINGSPYYFRRFWEKYNIKNRI